MSARDDLHPLERISAWLDGELDDAERAEVDAHLSDCAACRAFLEDLRRVARVAADEEPPPVPAGLPDRIAWRLRVGAKESPRPVPRPWWRSPVSLSAAATLAAIGILVGAWRLERGEPGVPALPAAGQAGAGEDRVAAPVEEKETDASREVGQEKALAGPDDGEKRKLPPARADAAAPIVHAPPPVAPEVPAPAAAPSFAPGRARDDGAGAERERAKGEAAGGIVGGVVGGVVGSAAGDAEGSGEAASEAAALPRETTPAAPEELPKSMTRSVLVEAKLAGARDEKSAVCPSVRIVSPPEGWRLRSADPGAARVALAQVAARLGGRATESPASPGLWFVEVPRGRWPELAAALRDLGVTEADPQLAVPESSGCVEARVAIAP